VRERLHQDLISLVAQVHHPVFGTLALMDKDLKASQVQGGQCQPGHLFYSQAASQHEHEHGSVTTVKDNL
jgi:hypothetical protein